MSRRPYDSSRRQQAAAAARAAMLDAGRALFVERGYAATTVADIATAAGVAPATVAAAFGGKAGLLRRLVDVGTAGDDAPVAVNEREIARQVSAEPDPRRQLDLLAGYVTEVHGCRADLQDVLVQASGVDEQVRNEAAREQARRRIGMAEFVARVDADVLAVDRETAVDIIWALTEPRLYLGLVRERRWTPEQYRSWLSAQLAAAVLGSSEPG